MDNVNKVQQTLTQLTDNIKKTQEISTAQLKLLNEQQREIDVLKSTVATQQRQLDEQKRKIEDLQRSEVIHFNVKLKNYLRYFITSSCFSLLISIVAKRFRTVCPRSSRTLRRVIV